MIKREKSRLEKRQYKMKCSHCGQEIKKNDLFCSSCGEKVILQRQNCPNCGADIQPNETTCLNCGYYLPPQHIHHYSHKSRMIAVILGLLFGGIGLHNFYLGYSSKGFIQVCLFLGGLFTLGLTTIISIIWGFVEVVFLLTGYTDRDGDDHLIDS